MSDKQMIRFNSKFSNVGQFEAQWRQDQIKNEPMLFNCDVPFAVDNGGIITREFLRNMPDKFRFNPNTIVDSRVHMLMPGMYPAIPGWHHDDVARSGPKNQPNYERQPYKSIHCIGLVNAEIAPTMIASGSYSLPMPSGERSTYAEWNDIVEEQIIGGELSMRPVKSGDIVEFDWQGMHKCTAAIAQGWRWFILCTIREHAFTNEIRNQVNVYLDSSKVTEGW